MRIVLFTLLAVGVILLAVWGAANQLTGNNPPQLSIADMWGRPVVNITESRPAPSWRPHPLWEPHPLCSDPLMPLTLRIGIRCAPPPPVMFGG